MAGTYVVCPAFDQATLQTVRDASPVPRVPDRYTGDDFKLMMPVNYSLAFFDRLFR